MSLCVGYCDPSQRVT
ncbi:hypothetical protein F383_17942 [Gossypium arboreum]|uniref:Uncharacterized protein n=1 Tax=Gossypium arboreum TaxID=29729 RepID=A0A0B0NN79_GOSAR|nr:hypothetical protein F383_17942 [Gossypium arboreum]